MVVFALSLRRRLVGVSSPQAEGRARPGRTPNAEPPSLVAGNRGARLRRDCANRLRRRSIKYSDRIRRMATAISPRPGRRRFGGSRATAIPRDRLFAISFTDPQARDDDAVPQANRSSTQDQIRELTAFIDGSRPNRRAESRAGRAVARRLRDARICRGRSGGVAAAALGGTPNHGVFAIDALLGSEYNGRGAFLETRSPATAK